MRGLFKGCCLILSLMITIPAMAYIDTDLDHHWFIITNIGVGNYQHVFNADGRTLLGRVGFGYDIAQSDAFIVGLELGTQNGNTMRLLIPQETLDTLGGEPIEGTIKPIPDALLTLKIAPLMTPAYLFLKGGVSYRHWQMQRDSVNDLSEYTPEAQGGIGFKVQEYLDVVLTYQYMFGKTPRINADFETEQLFISHIPSQQAIFIGLSLIL